MELVEAPSFDDYLQESDALFEEWRQQALALQASGEQVPRSPFCTGRIQQVYIRVGTKAKLVAIGSMCQDCFAFWPKGDDYRRMPVRRET